MSRIEEKRDGENAMIEMKDVMKKYSNGTTAIRNISVEIDQGEFVYVVGPSGAGLIKVDFPAPEGPTT